MSFRRFALRAVVAVAGPVALGCTDVGKLDRPPPRPAAPLTQPTRLCHGTRPTQPCRSALEVERWMRHPELRIVGTARPPAGKQAARVLTLSTPGRSGPIVFRAKWRAHSTFDHYNVPRRELAAYAVQKLFLQPHEYVVPPAAGHCFDVFEYRAAVDSTAMPSFRDTGCVFGILSYWLEDVSTLPEADDAGWFDWDDGLLDEKLFERSAVYRSSLGHLNLLTYLIEHADTHWKQFLISENPRAPVVYSIDNSVAFGARKNPNLRQDWSDLLVPALPRRAVETLATLPTEAFDRLASIERYEYRGTQLISVEPGAPVVPNGQGMRRVGNTLTIGLTAREIALVRNRAHALPSAVALHGIRLY